MSRQLAHTTIGVSFHAGGVQPFLSEACEETTDCTVPLDAVSDLHRVAGHLCELTADGALDLLERELVERLPRRLGCHRPLLAEEAIRSGVRAGEVWALIGEDRRRAVPEFRRTVGVSPKRYERLHRFRRSIARIRQPDPAPLATIAAELGFADQAHLTREVVHFAGVTPSLLHGDETGMPNHIDTDKIFKT